MNPMLLLILVGIGLVVIGGFFVLMFSQLAAKHEGAARAPSGRGAGAARSGTRSSYKKRQRKSR